MGRTITPKYVATAYLNYGMPITVAWSGARTIARLESWRKAMNTSFATGTNRHISESAGVVIHVVRAEIRRNVPGAKPMSIVNAPTFEAVG